MLESVGRQDKKDKMVDSLETEAWLEQDNCGTVLPNKTKVRLQGEVFCVISGP